MSVPDLALVGRVGEFPPLGCLEDDPGGRSAGGRLRKSLGEDVPVGLRTGRRLAATHAARTSAEVVRAMHGLGGASSIHEDSPLQRRLRDADAITAHIQVAPTTWEVTGRLLLGVPTDIDTL
jgi:hypothetical protein